MRDYIRKRVVDVSLYIVKTNATVRQAALVFGVSKSTVHKDVTERLPRINKEL
ncbi:MAG: stage III sporulation protein D, partial [Firmicutes bacterium]|nr:stage III sporulation protein D [Bacillota bacterium]